MKIYFARTIRGQTNVNVDELQNSMKEFGEVLSEKFDYSLNVSKDKQIFELDTQMLSLADVVVAEVSNPSLGVGYEIGRAEKLGKPVLCLGKEGVMISAMVTANPYVTFKRYNSIQDAHYQINEFLKSGEMLEKGI